MEEYERQQIIDAGRGHLVGEVDHREAADNARKRAKESRLLQPRRRAWLRFVLAKARRDLQQAKSERARLIREAWNEGMTQHEIGELLGISKSRVGRILNRGGRCQT